MTPAAIASVAAGMGVRLTMSSSPITTRITGHRSVSRSRRSTEITLVFASSARTPMRISRPGQKKLPTGRQIAGGHSCEVVRCDLQQALLEALAFLEGEAGEPVDRLAAALDVR